MKRILKVLGLGLGACLGLAVIGALVNPNKAPSSAVPTPTRGVIALVDQAATPTGRPIVNAPTIAVIAESTTLPTTAPTATALPTVAPQAASLSPNGDAVNVRSGPGTNYPIVTSLVNGQSVNVIGRNAASDWLQIERGWVNSGVVTVVGDASQVAVVEVAAPVVQDVPAPAQPLPTIVTSSEVNQSSYPCNVGQIKGNIKTNIYHVPSGPYYSRTRENVRCFDTFSAAEAAGFHSIAP